MWSRRGPIFLTVLLAGASASSCGDRQCQEGPGCGPAVIVTFKQPVPIEEQELVFEASFDGRVLRCRSRRAEPRACDEGISLGFHSVQPDAGPDRDDPLKWPSFADDVSLQDVSPQQLTVRILRGGQGVSEQSFSLTYREVYSEVTCRTCRQVQVSM